LRKIQDTTESNSDSNNDSETGDVIETDGWDTETGPITKEERSLEFNIKLIKLANKKAS